MRIVFLGTSDFALPALERLIAGEYEIAAVYTQPDRPAGRGRRERASPVKEAAQRHELPIYQPARLGAPDVVAKLAALQPDVMVAAAYGQILRQPVLDLAPLGVLNIHPSLLPRYRGAAPVVAAMLNGDEETGVTVMRMVLALDEGPILSQRKVTIQAEDTAGSLTNRLAAEGADLLMETLPVYASGHLTPIAQDDSQASYVPMVKKEDGLIDWRLPASLIWRRVRAYNPWPSAYTHLDGSTLLIHEAWPLEGESGQPAGTIVDLPAGVMGPTSDAGFAVQTGEGLLAVLRVQREGTSRVDGEGVRPRRAPLARPATELKPVVYSSAVFSVSAASASSASPSSAGPAASATLRGGATLAMTESTSVRMWTFGSIARSRTCTEESNVASPEMSTSRCGGMSAGSASTLTESRPCKMIPPRSSTAGAMPMRRSGTSAFIFSASETW